MLRPTTSTTQPDKDFYSAKARMRRVLHAAGDGEWCLAPGDGTNDQIEGREADPPNFCQEVRVKCKGIN